MSALVAICGAGTALGLLGAAATMRQASHRTPLGATRRLLVRSGAPLFCGAVVGLVTRWPVAAVLGAATVVAIPYLLRHTSMAQQTARIEAVAVWTELLRDTLSASAGLAQAIIATAPVTPTAIQLPVALLAERIVSGVSMSDALLLFGADVDDPSVDLVVCALLLAATSRAQRLSELLSTLAASTRDEVAMRLRVEASRASTAQWCSKRGGLLPGVRRTPHPDRTIVSRAI